MAKALGIGGVFFRARDADALAKWYETHLGVPGFWTQEAGLTIFAPFKADTDYFPPGRQWMINFRVDDLDGLIAQLKAAGIAVETRGVGHAGDRALCPHRGPRRQSHRTLAAPAELRVIQAPAPKTLFPSALPSTAVWVSIRP